MRAKKTGSLSAPLPWLGRKLLWLDTPGNVTRIVWSLGTICVLLFLADLAYHKHPYFEIETVFGFYGLYGFFMCAGLVIAARVLRVFLKRPENYYGTRGTEAEDCSPELPGQEETDA